MHFSLSANLNPNLVLLLEMGTTQVGLSVALSNVVTPILWCRVWRRITSLHLPITDPVPIFISPTMLLVVWLQVCLSVCLSF